MRSQVRQALRVAAAYRPTGKGRVERQVRIVRDHVLAGRTFSCLQEVDTAFAAWVPIRRAPVHRILSSNKAQFEWGSVLGDDVLAAVISTHAA